MFYFPISHSVCMRGTFFSEFQISENDFSIEKYVSENYADSKLLFTAVVAEWSGIWQGRSFPLEAYVRILLLLHFYGVFTYFQII